MGKISFPPANSYSGIEMDLTRLNHEVVAYLNVFSIDLAAPDQLIDVRVVIENQESTYQARILKGGQRVLLPLEATEKMIEALSEDLQVYIQMGRYEQTIDPANFSNAYGELMMIPID